MNLIRIPRHLASDHNHEDEDHGNPNVAKATAMVVLFLASFIIGNLPIKLNQWLKWDSDAKQNVYVKFLLGIGGGVLLCTTFIHLLPEVSESFENLNLTPNLELHYAEILMCIGFFIMYFVEECVHVYLHFKQNMHNPPEVVPEMEVIRRSLSIRRGEDLPKLSNKEEHAKHSINHSHVGHSHIIINPGNSTVVIVRGLLVVLALSVHELFEGLAVGLESSSHTVWYMFGAVSAHKLVIAFCIGVELVASGLRTVFIVIYVFTFAVVSPLGIGIGIIVSNVEGASNTVISVILQGLASGTLMYVVFFEILQGDKRSGLKQFSAITLGFFIMFCITLLDLLGDHH
ncbi:unnamed protein product [Psylliodes chrysocephalus]|uniref:Uncharacterized protein n=1 Tax=Psylliodes chrysocephalus TaxID=3402493 RepID=A0A9P0GFJ8_9CUCU|nr:unnamed protein product [Psylliodes chrysocephala]